MYIYLEFESRSTTSLLRYMTFTFSLSPFQPGFGSLQLMSVHQKTSSPSNGGSLVFSVTDQGDAEDLSSFSRQECIDISPELVSM